jgi:TRAP-type C4-dicarboxylate transport system substrate-binding protein
MKRRIVLLIAFFLFFAFETANAVPYKGKVIKAKLASEEIEGDFMTVWGRNFSNHMKNWSGGRIQIDVYPYGTLGATGDINELAQMGIVQFVFSDHGPERRVHASSGEGFSRKRPCSSLDHV